MLCAAAGKDSVGAAALAAFAGPRAIEAFRCLLWILAVLQHHECGVHWVQKSRASSLSVAFSGMEQLYHRGKQVCVCSEGRCK